MVLGLTKLKGPTEGILKIFWGILYRQNREQLMYKATGQYNMMW